MYTRIGAFGLILVLLALGLAAQEARPIKGQDVLKLKNGREFKGRLIEENAQSVTFEFRGSEIVLPRRLVKEIERGERKKIVKKAEQKKLLSSGDRFDARHELYYVYYRGRRVGWREVRLQKLKGADGRPDYQFESRTVFRKKDGSQDLDLRVSERVDRDLRPVNLTVHEQSKEYNELRTGAIAGGHLKLRQGAGAKMVETEVLFAEETQLLMPLLRKLGNASHFPEKGKTFKIFDALEERFVRIRATRGTRKEWVAGTHQFVTVWGLESGNKKWEIWFDGRGSVIREELGSPHMVAVRADKSRVLAFARGEDDGGDPELGLKYENVPQGFRLVRPNLTWSYELPEEGDHVAISLMNPTLQASADVFAHDRIGREIEPETLLLDLIERLRRKASEVEILYQRPEAIGGRKGIRFELKATRRGVDLHTIGAVCANAGQAYTVLLAAPEHRYREARPQLEQILKSFEVTGIRAPEVPQSIFN